MRDENVIKQYSLDDDKTIDNTIRPETIVNILVKMMLKKI